ATTALMHLRKDRRVPLMTSIDGMAANDDAAAAADEPRDEASTPEDNWASSEAVAIAGERLAELGDKYGKIFSMRFVEGYSESEIARKLSLNVATVKTRAYRARAHLRRELEEALAA
ncbi:MAG: RNA polymerase sigma factor, partial [Polyangia bacterium]